MWLLQNKMWSSPQQCQLAGSTGTLSSLAVFRKKKKLMSYCAMASVFFFKKMKAFLLPPASANIIWLAMEGEVYSTKCGWLICLMKL